MSEDALEGGEFSQREPLPSDSANDGEEVQGSPTQGDAALRSRRNLVLPERFFPRGLCNPGFEPPDYLMNEELLASITPPAVVKTFDDRLAELSDAARAAFGDFWAIVQQNGWHDAPASIDTWTALRFLVARSYDLKKATKLLSGHVEWLAQVRPATVVCEACLADPRSHMQQFVGWDLQHRPVMYMSYKQCIDRANADNAIAHNLMTFECFRGNMSVGVEQWVAITDFVTYSHWKDGASGVGRKVIAVMQDHFPERLAMQILVDPPTSFWLLWKALSPFVDAKTKEKVQFVYTASEPKMQDLFVKLFPPHVASFLIDKYMSNKAKAPTGTPQQQPDPSV
jgi:hypothetical protein